MSYEEQNKTGEGNSTMIGIKYLLSKVGSSIGLLVYAWWRWYWYANILWVAIAISALAVVNLFLPDSYDGEREIMAKVRLAVFIAIFIELVI